VSRRKVAASASLEGIAGILAVVKDGERQRSQQRVALERVPGIIADVLN